MIDMSFESILERMLDRVPNTLDKREGSIIYDALAPAAAELMQMYIALEYCFNQSFVDSAEGDYLTRLCAQFGVERKSPTYTIAKGVFLDGEGNPFNVEIGSRYNLEDYNYVVVEQISEGTYKMQCEQEGNIKNITYGNMIPMDYVKGLATARLTEILIPGEDEESDESLRYRYYEYVRNPAYGGNIADYKREVKLIDGVGQVKVYPVWNGGGTVKLVLLDSDGNVPTDGLISTVQQIVDPPLNQGDGLGIAPIGHVVTVRGAESVSMTITTRLTLSNDYELEDVKLSVQKVINDYLLELRNNWENSDIIVRLAHIDTRILDVDGVIDVEDTRINNLASNLILSDEQVPILQEVTLL